MVFTNLALLIVIGVASLTIGFQTYVLNQLPVIMIGGALGLWLFYVQHQFENVYWARHEFWARLRVVLDGDDLPYHIWARPKNGWFQERLSHHLKVLEFTAHHASNSRCPW